MGTDELVGIMFISSMIFICIKVLGNSDEENEIGYHEYKEMPQDDNLNHI